MSVRAASVLVLGAVAYAAAWGFGSRSLAVVGLGLLVVGVGAVVWGRLMRGPVGVSARTSPAPACEGDTVTLEVAVSRPRSLPLGSVAVEAHWPRLGQHRIEVRGRACSGETRIRGIPRGVHRADRVSVTREDPLGLERLVTAVPALPPLVVRPRVVELDALFATGLLDARSSRARRVRPGGADIRSVRPHREGEALRSVHWPSTARHDALMVKESEDTSGGELVLLLDCDPPAPGARTPHGDTPFDVAVRAIGSIAVTLAAHGRSALLVASARGAPSARIAPRALDEALDLLAGVSDDAPWSLPLLLSRREGALASARELVVVTARPDAGAAAALEARASALVWVDAASWTGAPGLAPGLAALATAGIPVATLRHGDDLATVLAPRVVRSAYV